METVVLGWYAAHRRALAWRETTDPYHILVSEVMLQQTQAARVEPAFRAFVGRFPTVEALAAAPTADVLRAWRGLGYNRRAISLQRAARILVERHGGQVPADLGALRALPGVGEYTARAVLAFAFGRDAAPVDTNVARVLTRAVAGRGLAPRELQSLADELVPAGAAAEWSAALMDLGATHCRARAPRCDGCPLTGTCRWRADGGTDPWTAGRPQQPFAGSTRYHRGRLLDALRTGPVHEVGSREIADSLVRDGLAVWDRGTLRLP